MNKRKYKTNKAYLLPMQETDHEEVFWYDIMIDTKELINTMGRPSQDDTLQIISDTQVSFKAGKSVKLANEKKPRIIKKILPRPKYQKGGGKTIYTYEITLT